MSAVPPHHLNAPEAPAAAVGFTLVLDHLRPHHLSEAGAKAVTLGRMLQAGLPVPPGFVVTVRAFNAFLASAPSRTLVPSRRASPSAESAASPVDWTKVELESRRIREALGCLPFPTEVEQAIRSALDLFPDVKQWAVRSSATAEDGVEASFAGQHDSFLNISRDEIAARVQDCWLSLFHARALLYRGQRGVPPDQIAMAVIIQQMVAADTSGVIFTLDPLTSDPTRLVIEGTRGLGDQLVGGRITPERVVLARDSRKVLERIPGTMPPDASPGSAPALGDPAARPTATGTMLMDDRLAQALAELSQRVEGILPGPLDIEWAARGGKIFLLQARPITSRPRVGFSEGAASVRACSSKMDPSIGGARLRRAAESSPAERSGLDGVSCPAGSRPERQVWTNLNTGEVMPDVMTPATWSMIRLFLAPLFHSVLRLHGAEIDRSSLVGLVAGRLYFNANTGLAAIRPFPFLIRRLPNIARALGGGSFPISDQDGLRIPDADLPDMGFRWPKYILSWPRLLLDLWRHAPWRAEGWIARLKARTDLLVEEDLDSMSTTELAALFTRLQREALDSWDLLYLVTQAFALPLFQKACQDWLDDPNLSLGYRLFAAMGGVPEAEAGLALWRLAALAHADSDTEANLLAAGDWTLLRANLERTEGGRTWLKAWEEFHREHGHHCRGEIELINPRWAETPDYILGLVRHYLRAIDQSNPLTKQKQLAQERLRLTGQCRERLKNPIRRWIFTFSLRRSQTLALHREQWKNQAVRQIGVLRRALLALGRRLHQDGVLEDPDDIFFLEIPEIASAATGQAPVNARKWIAARKQEYEQNQTLHPPPVVFGEFTPTTPNPPNLDAGTDRLKGIPVSSGTVSGRARVILRSDDDEQIFPGEILIAPFTDPAWTPYFVQAAGLVADQGGILSHGSIVAREYGLPAVTNVGSATRLIRTGDLVHVDGNRGEVTILERAADARS